MGIVLFGPPRLLLSVGSIPAKIPWTRRRPNCLLPSPRPSTGPDRRALGLWMFQRTSSEPSPKILERFAQRGSLLHPSHGSRPTSTSMDTGCPSLLTLLPDPLLRRNRPSLAPTLEIASHPGIGVGRAVVLTNVAGAIDPLLEIVRSQGATAVARGPLLDTLHIPRGIDTSETLHPGGETKTHHYHQ
jgi:hypothetical protein